MCERRRSHAGGTLVALAACLLAANAGTAAPVAAQQPTEEELVRRLHELMPRLDSARAVAFEARAREERAAARPVASVDSFRVGPLRVLTPSDQRRVAEGFFRDVWESGYASFIDASPALTRTTFAFQWSKEPGRIPVEGTVRRMAMPAWRPASVVRTTVVATLSSVLAQDLPDSVAHWAGREVRDHREAAADVYRLMVERPSVANRRCIEGDVEACWTALALDIDDTPLDEWYLPEERRAMVAAWRRPLRMVTEWHACVDEGNTAACDLFLSRVFSRPPINVEAATRAMLWIALTAGGQGAWDRLRADPTASPAEALRAASGLDAHELATRWRAWLLAGAPPARARLDPHLLIDLMWIAAFAAFAARSTRWRLR